MDVWLLLKLSCHKNPSCIEYLPKFSYVIKYPPNSYFKKDIIHHNQLSQGYLTFSLFKDVRCQWKSIQTFFTAFFWFQTTKYNIWKQN